MSDLFCSKAAVGGNYNLTRDKEGTYFEYSNEMAAYDLMVIDDFGLMDLDIEKCRDLFEIIESRDCRKATIIISQIPVSGWYQLFGDSTYADAS